MGLTAEDILAQQKQDEHEHEISLADGTVLKFKNEQDTRQLAKIRQRAEKLAGLKLSQIPAISRDKWAPYMPIDLPTANIMAHLTMLMIIPTYNDLQALQLCREAGIFASFLDRQIMQRMGARIDAVEDAGVEAEKNDYVPTDGGAATSPSAETPSASIPTSSQTPNGATPESSLPSA